MQLAALDNIFSSNNFSNTSANGTIFDSNGNMVGVVPGSQADIGTGGNTAPAMPSIPAPPSTYQVNIPKILTGAANAAAAISSGGVIGKLPGQSSGIGLEDVIFMLLGLLLIAAGIFGFKQTQTVITNTAKHVAEAAS